jgi:hypothetical protein
MRRRRLTPVLVAVVVGLLALGTPGLAEVTTSGPAGAKPTTATFDPLKLPGVGRMSAEAEPGPRPHFSWDAVDGAASYSVVVQDLKGRPLWAWRGVETSVFLGGVVEPPRDSILPVLDARAQWQVLANGADGSIIGASKRRVVSHRASR